MTRVLDIFCWLPGITINATHWIDNDEFTNCQREQLCQLVTKLQSQSLTFVKLALLTRTNITSALAKFVLEAQSQRQPTELEKEWATLPRSRDPLAEFLLAYFKEDFAEEVRYDLGTWMLQPRFRGIMQLTGTIQTQVLASRASFTILLDELSIGAPLRYRRARLFDAKWLSSDVTIQAMSVGDDEENMFQQNANRWFRLNHPNIVKLFGVCKHEGKNLLVCEPLGNQSLNHFLFPIGTSKEQPAAIKWRKMLEIARGLQYLHSLNIVHGSVRLTSVWLGRDTTAKLDCSNFIKPFGKSVIRYLSHPRAGAPESLASAEPAFSTKSDVYALAKLIILTRFPEREGYLWLKDNGDHLLRSYAKSGALPDLSRKFSDAQSLLLRRMCDVSPNNRPTMADVESEMLSTNFRPELCEYASSMRRVHARNIFYGDLQRLVAIVRPQNEWISLSDEIEATKAFRIGCAVMDGIAPDKKMGRSVSQSSDIFELGVLIATMVSGLAWQDLFPGSPPPCVIGSFIMNNVHPSKPDSFSESEWDLIKRMCAFNPSRRPSISTVLEEMGRILNISAEAEDEIQLVWDPTQRCLPSRRIAIADALRAVDRQLNEKPNNDPVASGMRWILLRLQDVDSLLKKKAAQGFQVSISIVRTFENTLESLFDFKVTESSVGSFWSQSVCSTHQQIHALHRSIDFILSELRIPRSVLNATLHDWRQQWELEKHSRTRKIVTTCSFGEPSTTSETPEWFWPPYTVASNTSSTLGVGGFGRVYSGKWLDTPVVIKRVSIANEDDRVQFQHEVNVWYQLHHPHVIQLFGACDAGDDPFFVCEYAKNGRLDHYLMGDEDKRAKKSWEKLLEASLGLMYLHAKGIVHADLKCDNILISGNEKAKLADFGLSLDVESTSKHNCNQQSLGAVQWRAPEVLRGERPSFDSDKFSFGMCIYQAVSGRIPWGSLPPKKVVENVIKGELPERLPVFSDGQWELIQMMCCYEPRDRLHLKDVIASLRQIVEWNGMLDTMFAR